MNMHLRRWPLALGCAVACLMTAATSSKAEPAPAYSDLLSRLEASPERLEADAMAQAASALVRQARARPNPVLSAEMSNFGGRGDRQGFDDAETSLSLSQNLELFGRRGARIEAAEADESTASLQQEVSRLDVAGQLGLAYAEAEAADRRAAMAQESLTLTIADTRAALALVEQGREPMLRAIQAETEAAAARARLDEANAERDAAFARLQGLAMLPSPITSIEASLLEAPAFTPAPATGLPPSLRVARALKQAAERKIDVERTNGRPDISATVGMTQYAARDERTFSVGLSLPLPLFDRNRGNIDAAHAQYRAAEARLMAAERNHKTERTAAMARYQAAKGRVGAADTGVKAAEEAYRLARIGFETGRISQLELRATRTALIEVREAALNARLARVQAEITLAQLDGRYPFEGAR